MLYMYVGHYFDLPIFEYRNVQAVTNKFEEVRNFFKSHQTTTFWWDCKKTLWASYMDVRQNNCG